jgi:assimilatory nitrate reductase catalytic subunit
MTVDKGLFRRGQRQRETFDFHTGEFAPARWKSDDEIERYVPTHCCYCGVQCGMYLKVSGGKVVGVEPREDFPLNHGMLCPKGSTVYQTVNHPDRLLYPLMRRHGKNSPLERASWDEVFDTIVRRFQAIQRDYGKDAVSIFSGSSMTNEKCYLMGKFARVALGTRHVDYNGRLCMSSATGANERSLGIDRAANPVSDMLHADCIFVIGANVGECFPIVTSYLWQARDRGCKLIVADPRQTPIARTADLFLPLRSGTDSALLNGMLHVIIKEGLIDENFIRERTTGWEETKALVEHYPPERVAQVCGLLPEAIVEAARMYGRANNQTRRTPFLREMAPYPWVEMHEQMAQQLGVKDGEWVTVRTRRGELTAPALVVQSIRPDTLFIPYHYGHTQAANQLTNPVLEPMMKIPEFKVCAAAAMRAVAPPEWARGIVMADLLAAQKRRRELPIANVKASPTLR